MSLAQFLESRWGLACLQALRRGRQLAEHAGQIAVRAGHSARGLIWNATVAFLNTEQQRTVPLSPINFARLAQTVQPGDVLLVEGRTRVSRAIRAITHSIWTHSALIIGSLSDIRDPALRSVARAALTPEQYDAPILIESELGRGVFVSSLLRYQNKHLRLCRPRGLSVRDAKRVCTFALLHVGGDYDVRQLLDLARFLFPWWTIIPRRWHSSLFAHNTKQSTQQICSTLIARSFRTVRFPVIPLVVHREGQYHLLPINPRLVTPRDFDHSPYFEVIKYPLLEHDDIGFYRELPWTEAGPHKEEIRKVLNDFDQTYAAPSAEDSS